MSVRTIIGAAALVLVAALWPAFAFVAGADQAYEPTGAEKRVPLYDEQILAQTFRPAASGTISRVELLVQKNRPNRDLVVQLRTTENDLPSATVLSWARVPSEAMAPYSKGWLSVNLPPAPVTAGVRYALVLIVNNIDEGYAWYGQPEAGYAGGIGLMLNPVGMWQPFTDMDFGFRVYVGAAAAASPAPKTAKLMALSPSVGVLTPSFSPEVRSYSLAVDPTVQAVSFTATPAEADGWVRIGRTSVPAGESSGLVDLSIGKTVVPIEVIAPNGSTKASYTITVEREALLAGAPQLDQANTWPDRHLIELRPGGRVAQSFVPAVSGWLTHVRLAFFLFQPKGDLTLELRPLEKGVPGDQVLTFKTIPAASLSPKAYLQTFELPAARVEVGKPYVILAKLAQGGGGYYFYQSNVYPRGDGLQEKPTGWQPIQDLVFATYVSRTDARSPVTNPDLFGSELTSLVVQSLVLQPNFHPNITNYTVEAPTEMTEVAIQVQATNPTSVLTRGGVALPTADAGASLTYGLPFGASTFRIGVGRPGEPARTYNITVTRPAGDTPPKAPDQFLASGDGSQVSLVKGQMLAQTFTPAHTGTVGLVRLKVKASDANDDLVVQLRTVEEGWPADRILGSARIKPAQLQAGGWVDVSFPPAPVEAGRPYAIVLATRSSKPITAEVDGADPYTRGALLVGSSSGGWSYHGGVPGSSDSAFEVMVGTERPSAPPSGNTRLSGLTLSKGWIHPAFDPAVLSYLVDVPNTVEAVEIAAKPQNAAGRAYIVLPARPEERIDKVVPLKVGDNLVAIEVVAADGTTTEAYTLLIRRDLPPVTVTLDGKALEFDVPPVVMQQRVLLPLRAIFEALGAKVDYDVPTRTVTAVKDQITVSLVLGQSEAKVSGKTVPLVLPAQAVDGRTMVPVRFVTEALGAEIEYDVPTRTVIIKSVKP